MIVKNEERIITRCLNSVKPIVDGIVICDTGSTDKTKEVIRNYCQTNKIEFSLHEENFINFSYNRTLSFQQTQNFVRERTTLLQTALLPIFTFGLEICEIIAEFANDWCLSKCYAMLIDADMEFISGKEHTWKEQLIRQLYLVEQKNSSINYYNTRLHSIIGNFCV